MKKMYWVSRHNLSPAQRRAIEDLHGEVYIIHDPVTFSDYTGLAEYIDRHPDGFVYAVAGASHYLHAMANNCKFGVFENHHEKRADGQFGLSAVYHTGSRWWNQYDCPSEAVETPTFSKVWNNPDPDSDSGETLIPVRRV